MDSLCKLVLSLFLVGAICASTRASDPSFDRNYKVTWGNNHFRRHGSQVQIFMDKSSGAGFESKLSYGSGFFQMRIKVPGKDSAGVVTAFYLTSGSGGNNHDELDFEFMGNREGKPYTLQTNVFANGQGNREHRVHLWFDPRKHFHTYKILWNQHHIVFFVDNIAIRYFKNNRRHGVSYPFQPMKIQTSIWDGSNWATDGGQTKVNWSHAPFNAYFDGFNIDGCPINNNNNGPNCNSAKYWWNRKRYWELNPTEKKGYETVKHKYVVYDYCSDKTRYPLPPPECSQQ